MNGVSFKVSITKHFYSREIVILKKKCHGKIRRPFQSLLHILRKDILKCPKFVFLENIYLFIGPCFYKILQKQVGFSPKSRLKLRHLNRFKLKLRLNLLTKLIFSHKFLEKKTIKKIFFWIPGSKERKMIYAKLKSDNPS